MHSMIQIQEINPKGLIHYTYPRALLKLLHPYS